MIIEERFGLVVEINFEFEIPSNSFNDLECLKKLHIVRIELEKFSLHVV
jgi:hypothetical protein